MKCKTVPQKKPTKQPTRNNHQTNGTEDLLGNISQRKTKAPHIFLLHLNFSPRISLRSTISIKSYTI